MSLLRKFLNVKGKRTKRISMGDLSYQHGRIWPKLKIELDTIFESGDYVGGKRVTNFEAEFTQFTGADHCVGVGNGTDALEIALQALGLPKGSKVVVPANSFVATAEAVVNAGLTPIFVDVTDDFGIDLTALSNLLDDSVSAVIVVHLYGYPQNVGAIKDALDQREIKILEDCAQAHGAKFDEQHVGTMGDVGAFSFYPGKNLGALGDAGAIITNDAQLAESCRRISNHGRLSKFDHNIIGRNSRLDALQATVLSLKLKFLDTWNSRRRSNAETYRDLLGDLEGIVLPPLSQGYEVYHHFVIKTKQRDGLRSHLEKSGISTGIHYPESISAMKAFEHLDPVQCPVSDRLSAEMISLPVAEHLGRAEVEIVARSIRDFVLESKRPL